MATVANLVAATRRNLLTAQSEELNRLNGAIASTTTETITFEFDLSGIQPGATIAVDLEEIQVLAVDSVNKQVTAAIRGANGSTAATHLDDALVYVKPKFSNFRIFEALNNDLRDLSAPGNDLFQVKTVSLTATASQFGYDLTSSTNEDVLGIHEVRYESPGPADTWPRIRNFALARDMETGDFASGTALILYEAPYPGRTIRVKYKAPFTLFTALADDPEVNAGLQASMLDIPPLGAAVRLMSGRDIKRGFTEHQGDTRRAEEVRVGEGVQSMRGLLALRLQRIQAEAGRLQRLYPTQ